MCDVQCLSDDGGGSSATGGRAMWMRENGDGRRWWWWAVGGVGTRQEGGHRGEESRLPRNVIVVARVSENLPALATRYPRYHILGTYLPYLHVPTSR